MTAPTTTISTPGSEDAAQTLEDPELTITGSGKDRQVSTTANGEKVTCRTLFWSPVHGPVMTLEGDFFVNLAHTFGPHVIRFASIPDAPIFILRPESLERDAAILERAYQVPTNHEPMKFWDGDLLFDLRVQPVMVDGREVYCMTASGTKVPGRLAVPGYPDEMLIAVRPKHREEDMRSVLAAEAISVSKRRTSLRRSATGSQAECAAPVSKSRRSRAQSSPVCVKL